jgi:Mrp family chromosome partitioning ATPase
VKNIIGLVQVKGRPGRSTVSTNLAGELSKSSNKIDCTVTDIIPKLLEQEAK